MLNNSAQFLLDRMPSKSPAWPKLLGGAVASTSLGLIMWQIEFWCWRYGIEYPNCVHRWLFLLVPASLLFLSYPLYRARDWARRAVFAVGICLSIFAIIGLAIRAVVESCSYDAHVITAEMRIQQALGVMGQAGLALCVVTPGVPHLRIVSPRRCGDVSAA